MSNSSTALRSHLPTSDREQATSGHSGPRRERRREFHIHAVAAEPRLLSRDQAAAYCGIAPETFDSYRRRGILPDPLPGTKRWDRKLIDEFLDRQSGVTKAAALSPLDAWRASRHDQG